MFPVVPWEPVGPVGPVDPVVPVVPWEPVGPLGPVGPVGPVFPVVPVVPWEPVGPLGPVGPVVPVVPCEPVDPVGPVFPVVPCGPDVAATQFSWVPVEDKTWPEVPKSPSLSFRPSLNSTSPSNVESPEALTVNIGIPDISDTVKRSPVRSSVTENSCPWDPCISSIVDPEPSMVITLLDPDTVKDPVTFKAVPSNVRLASELIVLELTDVSILLSRGLV